MWHNETVNVWTHGLGAIAFMALLYAFVTYFPDMNQVG